MKKKIAAMAGADDSLRWAGVTRDHDAAIGRVKAVSVGKIPRAVRHGKSPYCNVCVFIDNSRVDLMIDNSRVDLMGVDPIGLCVAMFQAFHAYCNISYVSS